MARVNHKKVKQLIAETRGKITDRQFFTSRILAGHFEDMAAAQSKRYHYNRRVRVSLYWSPKDSNVASTNNMSITINTGNKLVTRVKGRENRYQVVCGLFAHELGHVLYTDFLASQSYGNSMARYHWFPDAPKLMKSADIRNESALWDYVKESPENAEMVIYIAHHISNVLEDGYIEDRVLTNFPGTLGMGLRTLRELHYEQLPTVTQLNEAEEDGSNHIFESILQVMLSYAKFGKIKYGDEPLSDPRVQIVFGLIDDIDRALMSDSAKDRLRVVNLVLVRCWEYVQDFCEICKQRQQDAAASGSTATAAQTLSEILQSMSGGSSIGEGSSTPVGNAGSANGSVVALARAQTRAAAKSSESEENSDSSSESEAPPQDPSESGEDTASSDQSEAEGEASAGISGGKQETSANPYHDVKNVVYRLKRTLGLIGLEDLIIAQGGTFILNPHYEIQTDFERFEEACNKIAREGNHEVISALYHGAMDLYKGNLLPRFDHMQWQMPRSAYYENMYLRLVKCCIANKFDNHDYAAAQKTAVEALAREPYDTDLMVALTISMCKQGNRNLAYSYFCRIKPQLAEEQIDILMKHCQKNK